MLPSVECFFPYSIIYISKKNAKRRLYFTLSAVRVTIIFAVKKGKNMKNILDLGGLL